MKIPKLDKTWTICSPKAVVERIMDQKNYIMILIAHPERAILPEKDIPFIVRFFKDTFDKYKTIELNYANPREKKIADRLYREYCSSQ